MPVVNIRLLEGRTAEQKEQLIGNVTHTIVETLQVPAESVRIILDEMYPEHFGIAGESVLKRRSKKEEERR